MNASALSIAPAAPDDVEDIAKMIRALAEYEKLTELCTGSTEDLRSALFGPSPAAEVLIARVSGAAAGFALFFQSFSTFLARRGIWLEDLFVRPEHRGAGVGKALIEAVAAIAVARDCGRLEWAVLDWNETAIGFYRGLGADVMPDWRIVRLTGPALARFGASSASGARSFARSPIARR